MSQFSVAFSRYQARPMVWCNSMVDAQCFSSRIIFSRILYMKWDITFCINWLHYHILKIYAEFSVWCVLAQTSNNGVTYLTGFRVEKGQMVIRSVSLTLSVLCFDNDEYEEGIKHFLLLWDRKSGFDCFFGTAFLGIMNVFDAAERYVTVIEKKGQKGRCGKSCNIIRGVFLALFMLGYSQARGP